MQKAEVFCLFDFETPNNKEKKADSGLIRLSLAISTFKAKKCKYK